MVGHIEGKKRIMPDLHSSAILSDHPQVHNGILGANHEAAVMSPATLKASYSLLIGARQTSTIEGPADGTSSPCPSKNANAMLDIFHISFQLLFVYLLTARTNLPPVNMFHLFFLAHFINSETCNAMLISIIAPSSRHEREIAILRVIDIMSLTLSRQDDVNVLKKTYFVA